MKNFTSAIIILFMLFAPQAYSTSEGLSKIKNFSLLSPSFASAGMPTPEEFQLLSQSGYQHIINLIPGNYSNEQSHVKTLDMSFEQIPVEWSQPTLENFQHFVSLMNEYKKDKVLLHCRLNYRASAFAYLYQTTQLDEDETTAKQKMLAIWEPNDTWLKFISIVQEHYAQVDNKRF
jgi:protein tyrosine phosphatase (PTP) superfamily phosphohydrolase (DUF442 family)